MEGTSNIILTHEAAVLEAKAIRKRADDLLQDMKAHTSSLKGMPPIVGIDQGEVIAQHILSVRDLESCIMRQGMVLKNFGTPNPYPNSKDISNTIVDPTADGLKM